MEESQISGRQSAKQSARQMGQHSQRPSASVLDGDLSCQSAQLSRHPCTRMRVLSSNYSQFIDSAWDSCFCCLWLLLLCDSNGNCQMGVAKGMRPGGIFRKIQSCVIEEYDISGFISDVFTRIGLSLFLRIGFNSNEYMR